MLYPILTETRDLFELCGIWRFKLDSNRGYNSAGLNEKWYESNLTDTISMPVPSSYNDLYESQDFRDHVGYIWYEKEFRFKKRECNENIILRFGSVTHNAMVFLNGQLIVEHIGGFTPFEVRINDYLIDGTNRLTVAACNIVDYTTIPVGNYQEKEIPLLGKQIVNTPNFDFFNYSGIHRPVKIYTTPLTHIRDIVILADYKGTVGNINYTIDAVGSTKAIVEIYDEDKNLVATGDSLVGSLNIQNVKLWNPRNAYLYEMKVSLYDGGKVADVYYENFGVRKVEVKDCKFYINEKPFYFKGFGKHEDAVIRGRGLDEVTNVKDIGLLKWMHGNSIRTSHYCYSEEFMRLCDREGIVVIDEVPAVGIMVGFGFDIFSNLGSRGEKPKTFETMKCHENHELVIKEMVARDKNHPCVVMWSIGNEPESWAEGADIYFKRMYEVCKEADPHERPITCVLIQGLDVIHDKVGPLMDVLCLNRYYGWYFMGGNLPAAKQFLSAELTKWADICPDKPIVFTEYGADTVSGLHDTVPTMFSEEYQKAYFDANHEIFDKFPQVVGEQAWNFADFETSQGIMRVQGNKKGVFTRERKPKLAAFTFKERWMNIPDFDYKK